MASGAATPRLVTRPDGRRLCVAEFGDSEGRPVVYCHGFPASRLEARLGEAAARRQGIRLIAMDRPGYGRSDFRPGAVMADRAEDVAVVADALGLARFGVLGVSGGGPYAALCAERLPGRVERLVLVAPLGNLAAPDATAAMDPVAAGFVRFMAAAPALALPAYRFLVGPTMGRLPAASLRLLTRAAAPVDRAVLRDRQVIRILAASLAEAFRQGGLGPAWDLRLYVHGWEVRPEHIAVPTRLFHGLADRTVPPAMGRAYAERIPGCETRYLPDEGHFSLPVRRMDEILAAFEAP